MGSRYPNEIVTPTATPYPSIHFRYVLTAFHPHIIGIQQKYISDTIPIRTGYVMQPTYLHTQTHSCCLHKHIYIHTLSLSHMYQYKQSESTAAFSQRIPVRVGGGWIQKCRLLLYYSNVVVHSASPCSTQIHS